MRAHGPWWWSWLAALGLAACDGGGGATALPPLPTDGRAQLLYAQNHAVATAEETAVQFAVTVTGDPPLLANPTVLVVRGPRYGALTQGPAGFTYLPALDFVGRDDFLFAASLSGTSSNTATVTIEVTPLNDLPTAADVFVATDQGVSVQGQLIGDDADGDPLTFELAAGSNDGEVEVDAGTGVFTFTPDPAFDGTATFTYTVADAVGDSDPASVEVLVIDRTPPVLTSATLDADEIRTIDGLRVINLDDVPDGIDLSVVADATATQMRVTGDVVAPAPEWIDVAALSKVQLTPTEGRKVVWVRVRDELLNTSAPQGDEVGLDTAGPIGSLTAPDYVSAVSVIVDVAATDLSPPLEFALGGDFVDDVTDVWQPLVTSVALELEPGEGSKTIRAEFRDQWGHVGATVDEAIVLDQTPPTGTIAVQGADSVAAALVFLSLTWTDARSPVTGAVLGGDIDGGGDLALTPAVQAGQLQFWPAVLSDGDGAKTITVRYFDSAANASTVYSALVTLDTTPPTLAATAVTVAGGASHVSATTVDLAVTTPTFADAYEMLVTGDVLAPLPVWSPYVPATTVTLVALAGTRTVWVNLRDALQNTTSAVSDTVILDLSAPAISTFTVAGGADAVSDTAVAVALSTSGGAFELQVTGDVVAPAGWWPLTTATTVTLTTGDGPKTLYLTARDEAGNESAPAVSSVTLDQTPPGPLGLTLAGGAAATHTTSITAGLSAPDAVAFDVTGDVTSPLDGAAMTASTAITLSGGDGAKTIYATFYDALGNRAQTDATIALDTAAPALTAITLAGGADPVSTAAVTMATLAGSGAYELRVTGDVSAPVGWVAFTSPRTVTLANEGANLVWATIRDAAGNVSGPVGDSVALDSTPPAVPAAPTVTAPPFFALDLTWPAVPDADHYLLYYDTDGGGAPYDGTGATGGDSPIQVASTNYVLGGLPADVTVYVALRAVDALGNTSAFGAEATGVPRREPTLTVRFAFMTYVTGAAHWRTVGADAGGESRGAIVAAAGDLDGDGIGDMLVAVSDVSGGRVTALAATNATALWQATGVTDGDRLGVAMLSVGDVDTDGVDDVAAGAPGAATAAGRVVLLSGADGSVLWQIDGAVAGDALGAALAGPGDLNGDGVADVVAGAPDAAGGGTARGTVYAFSGTDGSELWQADGAADGDAFGSALAAVSDWDDDGIDDVIVGAPGHDAAGSDRGASYVLGGADGGTISNGVGFADGDRLGAAVLGLADFDGDGHGEMLIGVPGSDAGGVDAGAIYAVRSTDANPAWDFLGRRAGDTLGSALASIADADGDGVADALVGVPGSDRGGNNAGGLYVLGTTTGTPIARLDGTVAGAAYGTYVAGVGDGDDDGLPNVAVGAVTGGAGVDDFGQVTVERLLGVARDYARAATASFALRGNAATVTAQAKLDGGSFGGVAPDWRTPAFADLGAGAHMLSFRPLDDQDDRGDAVNVAWAIDLDAPPPANVTFPTNATTTSGTVVAGTITDATSGPGGGVGNRVGGLRWAIRLVDTDRWWDGAAYTLADADFYFAPTTAFFARDFSAELSQAGTFEVQLYALDGAYQPAPTTAGVTFDYTP